MIYTVYGLHEAGKSDEIQYVGMTELKPEQRLSSHVSACVGRLPVNRWIAKVVAEHKQIACRIFIQTELREVAAQMEAELIVYFAGRDGPLYNVRGNPRARRTPRRLSPATRRILRNT